MSLKVFYQTDISRTQTMNKDKKDNNSNENPLMWRGLGFFSAEDYLVYIFKKTEKITSALYLVSGLLKDEEPLKWELRDKGMNLISASFSASSSVPGDKNSMIQTIFGAALETISLLNVARVSNLISDMNHRLLVGEIDRILHLLREQLFKNAATAGYVLSESYFDTPSLFSAGFRDVRPSDSRSSGQSSSHVDEKKAGRQSVILDLLKNQSNLTIKDFSKVITDCSEKTIQRELLDMVEKGIIKKEGERRWSKYSLM